MDLSAEDALRLNVLLANKPLAIRIDSSRMQVLGLTERGEARVQLNPTGRDDQYLKQVRELLSGHFLGSPGGYPVFLRRWTRMGQMRDQSLAQLLLLGEPEAVVAAVCAPGLTDELARRAWWAMEDAENARRMLGSPAVVGGEMGPVLARYLIDYLPFETEAERMAETVRLVLHAGLIDGETRSLLWKKAARKQAYLVGFLWAMPDDLPEPLAARPDEPRVRQALAGLAADGNAVAALTLRSLSPAGQTFLDTVRTLLGKAPTQDVVSAALDIVRGYYAPMRPQGDPDLTMEGLLAEAGEFRADAGPGPARDCLLAAPDLLPDLAAMRLLSGLGYGVVRPVFRDTTAIGSLMRRKLAPVLAPVMDALDQLRGG